jgi:hypothetical protein
VKVLGQRRPLDLPVTGERKGGQAMADDRFEVDRRFAPGSDESRTIESLGEVLASLEVVQEARRRLAKSDPATRRAAIVVCHSRPERP